jgi:hypothetical protein
LGLWPAWFQTIIPDFHGSKNRVILHFLPAKILPTRGAHNIHWPDP